MRNKRTNTTSKKGVNFVKTIVEESECFFHKIEQESDLGIDAIIELIKDEKPLNKSIAIQIKSGPSYYIKKKQDCIIPIDSHREYWENYPLPVYGIVYIPDLKIGYWIDIKTYLEHNKERESIRFKGNKANLFDFENFNNVFIPKLRNNIPAISFLNALELFDSSDINEFTLGSIVLFRRYVNEQMTWNKFFDFIADPKNEEIPNHLIYYLAHIPGHPDIFYYGEQISVNIRKLALDRIRTLDRNLTIRLLSQIDEEDDIARGTIGQSIEAIISRIENKREILERNIIDSDLSIHIRQLSALLYGYYYKIDSLDFLKKAMDRELWIIPEIIEQLNKHGSISIY